MRRKKTNQSKIRLERRNHSENGMTLVEVMLAASVVIIAALGTLCYEYLCVDHVRFARAQMTATRIGQLLIEDWKSTGGKDDYSPEDLNMNFILPPEVTMGDFMTIVDGLPLYISMDQDELLEDEFTGVKLNQLNVSIRWRRDLAAGAVGSDDPSVTFNTYVRRDQ